MRRFWFVGSFVLTIGAAPVSRAAAPFTLTPWKNPFLVVTSRPFSTYNWVEREKVGTKALGFGVPASGPLDAGNPKLGGYIRDWSAYYFQSLKHGLYLGTDPVYYRAFGGTHYLLWRLRLHSGLRFLDFHRYYGRKSVQAIPDDARAALAARGCQVTAGEEFEDLFRGEGFGADSTPECAAIVFATVRELRIDAIKYKKGCASFEGVARDRQDFALILISTSWIRPGDVAFFYREMNEPGLRAEQIQIEKLYLEVSDPENYYDRRPWPELDKKALRASGNLLGREIVTDSAP